MKYLRITLEGKTYEVGVEVLDGASAVAAPAPVAYAPAAAPVAAPAPVAAAPAPAAAPAGAGEKVTAPMAGILLKACVKVGDTVTAGQEVAVLEAMKMETSLPSPVAGTVTSVLVASGTSVTEGQVLLTIG